MTSCRLRARLWLEHHGLFPRGKLAFFALYVIGIDLLLLVIEKVRGLFRSTVATSLTGWIIVLTLLALVLLGILGVRRFWSRLLWPMRSRLVLTYAFIGVIPLVLLAIL